MKDDSFPRIAAAVSQVRTITLVASFVLVALHHCHRKENSSLPHLHAVEHDAVPGLPRRLPEQEEDGAVKRSVADEVRHPAVHILSRVDVVEEVDSHHLKRRDHVSQAGSKGGGSRKVRGLTAKMMRERKRTTPIFHREGMDSSRVTIIWRIPLDLLTSRNTL